MLGYAPMMGLRRLSTVAALCSLGALATPLAGCGGSQAGKLANVASGEMPSKAKWDGVYFSELYGSLHLKVGEQGHRPLGAPPQGPLGRGRGRGQRRRAQVHLVRVEPRAGRPQRQEVRQGILQVQAPRGRQRRRRHHRRDRPGRGRGRRPLGGRQAAQHPAPPRGHRRHGLARRRRRRLGLGQQREGQAREPPSP